MRGIQARLAIACGLLLPCARINAAENITSSAAPEVRRLTATIDQQLGERWQFDQVKPAPRASDAEFMRRIYLDLAGRIPSRAEARAFLDDAAADKRYALIDRLLDSPDYINHFTNVWRELLLPEASANPENQVLTPGFESWLRKQIATNARYDHMVRDIITMTFTANSANAAVRPAPGEDTTPIAFYLAKDVKPENLAASTARLFLGIRLECAQCHHHPFARWKREQFWGYAAFFAGLQRQNQVDGGDNGPIREIFDRREMAIPGSSQVVAATFLDGSEPQWRFRVGSRVTLAQWMTAADNPFFARAAVNRLWGHFFGTGFVDPVDDLEGPNAASHPELLDALAKQFTAHEFDWKFMIRAIVSSRAYQLSSALTDPSQNDPAQFARMALKGLTAEQVFDSLVQATGFKEPVPANPPADEPVPARSPARAEFLARFASSPGDKRTEAQTSILQALALMNGSFIADILNLNGDGTLAVVAGAPSLTTAQKVEELFLATLSRRPSAKESARLVKYIAAAEADDSKKALADVFWTLLNSGEFILNH